MQLVKKLRFCVQFLYFFPSGDPIGLAYSCQFTAAVKLDSRIENAIAIRDSLTHNFVL